MMTLLTVVKASSTNSRNFNSSIFYKYYYLYTCTMWPRDAEVSVSSALLTSLDTNFFCPGH